MFCGARLAVLTTCPVDIAGFTFVALAFSVRHVIAGWVAGRLMCSKLAFFHSFSVSLFFTNVAPVIPWMLFFYTGDFGTAW